MMSVPGYSLDKYEQNVKMYHAVPDLPSGPLDVYRKRASFNWKDMVMFLEGEDVLAFKVGILLSYCNSNCK